MSARRGLLLLLLLAVTLAAADDAADDDRWRQQQLLRQQLPDISWSRLTALQRLVDRNQHRFTTEDFLDKTGTLELFRSLPRDNPGMDILNLLVGLVVGPYISPIMDPDISPVCRNHSWAYVTNILNLNNSWAVEMFDSDAKLPDGLFAGNINGVGNWDECLGVEASVSNIAGFENMEKSTFRGKHCQVTFQLPQNKKQEIAKRFHHNKPTGLGLEPILPPLFEISGQTPGVVPTSSIGLCIPSSCSAEELRRGVQKRMPTLEAKVSKTDCHVKGQKVEFSAGDIVMIVILIITGLLMAFGTFIDVIKDKAKDPNANITLTVDRMCRGRMSATLQKVLLSFSVWTNGRKILDTATSSDTLGCLHGIRFLSMSWVVLGHQYVFGIMYDAPVVNQLFAFDVFNSLAFAAVDNATVSVDSFFFLSGLLVAYIFMRNMQRSNGKFNIVMYYVHRYIRLTPVLAMVIAFVATLGAHLGEGPFWGKNVVTGSRYACSVSWWKNLLYFNNFNSDDMCLGQTWYLSNDMQMFILSPIVLLPLYFYPTLGQIWVIVLLALNFFITGYVTDYNDLGPSVGGDDSLRYFKPYCRYGAYLVGVYTGWFLHKRRGRRLRMTLPVVLAGWLISALVACLIVYGLYDYNTVPPKAIPSRSVSILYAALNRPVWAMCLAWVVIACVHGYGGFINSLLSWRFWIPLSRLTYCYYLVSIDVQVFFYASLKSILYFDQTQSVYQYLATMMVAMPVALLFSLAFEAPMLSLEKIIFANVGATKAPKPIVPSEGAQQDEASNKRTD